MWTALINRKHVHFLTGCSIIVDLLVGSVALTISTRWAFSRDGDEQFGFGFQARWGVSEVLVIYK